MGDTFASVITIESVKRDVVKILAFFFESQTAAIENKEFTLKSALNLI